jgi:hypothetical protein
MYVKWRMRIRKKMMGAKEFKLTKEGGEGWVVLGRVGGREKE